MRRLRASLITITLIIGLGILCYIYWDNNYYMLEDFYDFPIPKNAELESENEMGKHYYWKRASSDHGIPLSYELMISRSGWEEVERMGETGTFVKGKYTIYLQSSTDYIGIMK